VTWTEAKEIIVQNKKKAIDPIPESFASAAEAGEFWDTHSLTDNEEFLVPANLEFEITERAFEVRVAEDIFERLQPEAEMSHQSLPKTVDRLLRRELSLEK
jgi:hypothetical protein